MPLLSKIKFNEYKCMIYIPKNPISTLLRFKIWIPTRVAWNNSNELNVFMGRVQYNKLAIWGYKDESERMK